MWLWMLIGYSIFTKAHGYSDGAFPEACGTMSPVHRGRNGVAFPPQSTDPPYEITYELGRKGDPITVSLQSLQSTPFRGFMLEARETNRVEENHRLGSFTLLPSFSARLLTCEGVANTAVSQRNNQRKTLIKVTWIPQEEELNITFRATFVQSEDIFWERVDEPFNPILLTTPPPTTQPSTTASTVPSTTISTTTASTTQPSTTQPSTTQPSTTTASTTQPSTTTASTTQPSTTTASTTTASTTTASTTQPSTTQPSTTTASTTTASTTQPSTTTASTTQPSTTTASTTQPSTTTASTTQPSTTTASTTQPSTTTASTTKPITPKLNVTRINIEERTGTALMSIVSLLVEVKMELSDILTAVLHNSLFSHRLSVASSIFCSLLCMAAEIAAAILFCVGDSCNVTALGLTCAVIVINFIELVILSLSIGPCQERKEICGVAVKLCFIIQVTLTIAVVFVGILELDNCRKNTNEFWLLKVMIAYTVWIFLFIIWIFVFKIESFQESLTSRQQSHKKKLCAARVAVIAVLVILNSGATAFLAAIIVGIYGCRDFI